MRRPRDSDRAGEGGAPSARHRDAGGGAGGDRPRRRRAEAAGAVPDRRPAWLGARRLATELLAALAPPACLACRAPLTDAAEPLCAHCRRALPWLRDPRCPRCALPAPCHRAGGACPASAAAFARSWAPLAHAGPARALVGALKFRGALAAADLMAGQIAAGAPDELLAGAALVPVPADPARRRARGFDQAMSIAAALGARSGRPLAACLRRGAATRQLGAGRAARRAAAARLPLTVVGRPPARALLVDDVHTTGATLDACARALRAAGAVDVAAVTYTRTLPR